MIDYQVFSVNLKAKLHGRFIEVRWSRKDRNFLLTKFNKMKSNKKLSSSSNQKAQKGTSLAEVKANLRRRANIPEPEMAPQSEHLAEKEKEQLAAEVNKYKETFENLGEMGEGEETIIRYSDELDIVPTRHYVKTFDVDGLDILKYSLKKYGQILPVVLNKVEVDNTIKYNIVDGVQRWELMQTLGDSVRTKIIQINDEQERELHQQLNIPATTTPVDVKLALAETSRNSLAELKNKLRQVAPKTNTESERKGDGAKRFTIVATSGEVELYKILMSKIKKLTGIEKDNDVARRAFSHFLNYLTQINENNK